MARLNEVLAPATESVEVLKRRCIRQNREIARVNSQQSQRIRNLEIEISRLLAENMKLREEAISAKEEAHEYRNYYNVNSEVIKVKDQLEQKLIEVNTLVKELSLLPERTAMLSDAQRRKVRRSTGYPKTDRKEDRQNNRQLQLEQHGRLLPAIHEDKQYPRRTLEAREIQEIKQETLDGATDSPDLGPPPVAHFDETEAVSFNAVRSPRRTLTELIEETERTTQAPTNHIENRRKRRTSTLLAPAEIETSTNEEAGEPSEPPKKELPTQLESTFKTGAKRKLDVSELEDTSRLSKELDEFIFQRKPATTNPPPKLSRFSRPPGRQNQENAQSISTISPEKMSQPARKILAPKSTNSPAKQGLSPLQSKPEVEKENDQLSKIEKEISQSSKPEKRLVPRNRNRPSALEFPPITKDLSATNEKIHQPPKTPAAELDDILSPFSTEPSTKPGPPKEAATTASVEDVLNGSIGRGSRRARAAVSYAEPNLRDKMRRPGKELVGAVEGLARPPLDTDQTISQARRTSIDIGVGSATRHIEPTNALNTIQRASHGKSESASPLNGKEAKNDNVYLAIAEEYIKEKRESLSKSHSRSSLYSLKSTPPHTDTEDEKQREKQKQQKKEHEEPIAKQLQEKREKEAVHQVQILRSKVGRLERQEMAKQARESRSRSGSTSSTNSELGSNENSRKGQEPLKEAAEAINELRALQSRRSHIQPSPIQNIAVVRNESSIKAHAGTKSNTVEQKAAPRAVTRRRSMMV